MANLQQVGIELQVKGEAEAQRALDNLSKSSRRVTNSIGSVANSVQGAEREFLKLVKLNERNMLSDKALASAKNQLAKRIAVLNGEIDKNGTIYKKNAANALEASKAAMQKAEADKRVAQATREAAQQARAAEKARKEQEAADRRAAQAAEQLVRAQKNLEGSVLKQARAVDQAVRRMDELKRLQQSGAAGSRDMAKAEIEVARALARTNGYLKSNGNLNTQKALAEVRAAQSTRDAAKASEEKARADQRAAREAEALARETEQLAAAYNPVMAAARVYEQRIEQLNRAKKLGVLTEDQMQAELAQSAAAYNEIGQDAAKARGFINNFGGANHIASRQTNAFGMAMQQGGYQIGDFIVQVQSGTNAFVAFGQQATQLVGILPAMADQFGLNANKLIGISSALGIAIPLVTALGAALVRTDDSAKVFERLEESLDGISPVIDALSSGFSVLGNAVSSAALLAFDNLDRLLTLATVVGVFFAGRWVASTSAAQTAITAVGVAALEAGAKIQTSGVRSAASAISMNVLAASSRAAGAALAFAGRMLTRFVLPIAAAVAATEAILFVLRQFKNTADEISQTDMEKTLSNLASGGIDTEKVFDELTQSVQDYEQAISNARESSADLREEFGNQADEIERIYQRQAELARVQAEGAIRRSVTIGFSTDDSSLRNVMLSAEQIEKSADVLQRAIEEDRSFRGRGRRAMLNRYKNDVLDFAESFGLAEEKALGVVRTMGNLQNVALTGTYEEQAAAVQQVVDALLAAEDPASGLTKAAQEYIDQLLKGELTIREFIALNQDNVDLESKATAEVEKKIAAYESQARINRAILEIAGETASKEEIARARVVAQVREYVRINELGYEQAQNLERGALEAFETEQAVKGIGNSLDTANDKTSDFTRRMEAAASAAEGIRRAIDSIGLSNVALEAEVRALEAGRSEAESRAAGQVAAKREELAPALQSPLSDVRERALKDLNTYRDEVLRGVELAQRRGAELEARRSETGDDGGGATEQQEDYLRQLQQEADLKLRMIGLSEQEQRRLEIENELNQKGLAIEDKRIEQVLRTEQALRRAQQAEKRREDIMNTVSSNIESALMSVVDGTKSVEDAFRGMLRNIILEIYKQQVAQPFAQQAGNFITSLFSANGNVFNHGSHVQAYANGGVVGGPTYFPMSGGKTGLMGEAGPEAIMPLKRTKGGKLGVVAEGGGENVTVVQNFNISANGDDSVKRIVRAEAPRIAEQAKAAVVDAKQRGGSYGRAFR